MRESNYIISAAFTLVYPLGTVQVFISPFPHSASRELRLISALKLFFEVEAVNSVVAAIGPVAATVKSE